MKGDLVCIVPDFPGNREAQNKFKDGRIWYEHEDDFSPLCLCIAALIIDGCVNPLPLPEPTPGPTVLPKTTPDLNPLPTSVVPPIYHVSIQIQKNTVSTDPWISVVYEGGAGLVLPSLVEATVIRSDGITEQESAREPPKRTEFFFDGTTRPDRVIVNVTYIDGSFYTVRDELVPFQNISPS
jgi:hypothetical protein